MKKNSTLLVATVVVLMVGSAHSQENSPQRGYFPDIVSIQQADYSIMEKKYAECLKSENDGVVESALAHVAMFKLMYPVKELAQLKREVDRVATRHSSNEIRYKAYVVASLFENPRLFAGEARTDYDSPDDLFAALSGQLHRVIVSNMNK